MARVSNHDEETAMSKAHVLRPKANVSRRQESQESNVSTATSNRALLEALHAAGPTADRADKLSLYAWLVGRWDMDVVVHQNDRSPQSMRGFISAGWILEGRAIQDVFAVPGLFYGTSVRFYDPNIDAWQVFWMDPLRSAFFRMIGRARGKDIVNEGRETPELARAYKLPEHEDAIVRWSFTEITANSFHWLSQRSTDGTAWRLQREYFARRLET
jgi:hypothetical protein